MIIQSFTFSIANERCWRNVFLCLSLLWIAVVPLRPQQTEELPAPLHTAPSTEATQGGVNKQFRTFGSDVIAYWYGSRYRTPFVLLPGTDRAANIVENSVEYTHVGYWSKGSNFADVQLDQSNMAQPAAGGGTGATEIYAILRSDIGLNEVTRSNCFRKGLIRDIAVEGGANFEAQNSSFAPAERTLYIGPKLQISVPKGYLTLGLHFRKEWNYEGILAKSEHYHSDFNAEPNWMFPFAIGKLHATYSGFADYNTEKGTDSFGTATRPEFLIRSALNVDVGRLLVRRAELVDVSAGLWYWQNEYGKPSDEAGATQLTPMIGVIFHLNGGKSDRAN